MKKFDCKNGWYIEMYEENELYFNSNKVAVVDYDNDLITIIKFEDNKIDFIGTSYRLRPTLLLDEKTIVIDNKPEDD